MPIPQPAAVACYAPDTDRRMGLALAALERVREKGIGQLGSLVWMLDAQQSISLQAGFSGIAALCAEMQQCLKAALRGRRSIHTSLLELERHCSTIRSHAEAVAGHRVAPSPIPRTG